MLLADLPCKPEAIQGKEKDNGAKSVKRERQPSEGGTMCNEERHVLFICLASMSLRGVSHRRIFPRCHEVFRVRSKFQQSGRLEEAGLFLQPTIPGNSSPPSQCEVVQSSHAPRIGHLHVKKEMKARKRRTLVTVVDCPPARSCWSCGQKSDCSSAHQLQLLCNAAGCGAVQPIDCDSDINFYELFGCPIGVIVNDSQLDRAFLSLQKKLHPDKFASRGAKHQEVSGRTSAMVNMAYQTMKNPVERVQYLFKLSGIINVIEEGNTLPPRPDLLNEVFEVREKLENCKSQDEVRFIMQLNHAKICEILEELQSAFIRRDYKMLADGAIRLQYFSRIQDDASNGIHSF